jgi:hypothetical protein
MVLLAVPAVWLTDAVAQESTEETLQDVLCEQCPFDAPVRQIRRGEFSPSRSTTVITAEDMRAMGVISVADMIRQLPGNNAVEEDSSEPADAAYSDSPDDTEDGKPAAPEDAAIEVIE